MLLVRQLHLTKAILKNPCTMCCMQFATLARQAPTALYSLLSPGPLYPSSGMLSFCLSPTGPSCFRPASMLLSLKHARLVPVRGTCTGALFLLLESLSPDLCRAASSSFRFHAKQKTWASLAQAAHGPDLPLTVVLRAMHLYLMVGSVFISIFTCLFAC